MKKEVKVRKLQKKDAEACSILITKTMAHSNVLTKKEQEHIKKETSPKELIKSKRKKKFFVCLKNNKLLGIGALIKNEIKTMYTSPKFQNRGIGSKILKKIEKEAKKNKIKKLFLYTHPEAAKFYLKNKFKVIRKFKDKNNLPIVYMKKEVK